MKEFQIKANSFLNSYFYPVLIFLAVLISHTFSIELFGCIFLIVSSCIGLLFSEDLKFLISPLIMFIFTFSQKSVKSGTFYETPYIVAIIIVSTILLSIFIARFIIRKKDFDFKAPLKSKLFIGVACLCASFLLNGLFNFDEYTPKNLIFALALCLSIGFVFYLFSIGLKPSKDLKKYFFFVLYLTSILLVLEFFLSFIYQFEFVNGELNKESILFGWGMWNNMGGILAYLLPVHFYFASTVKRYGWVFYLTGVISFCAIALSLSRSSLLLSSIVIVPCAVISCFKGENRKINRIITSTMVVVGIVGIIVFWDKISSILGDLLSRGFDDNGRFEMYRHGLLNFTHNPVFGGGFYSSWAHEYQFIPFLPYRYHNTIIQLLGTCGIVGFGAYLYHRYETIKLFWRKRSLYTAFSSLCLICFLGTSLLDNHFFNLYPSFIYVIMLLVIEKSENDYISK